MGFAFCLSTQIPLAAIEHAAPPAVYFEPEQPEVLPMIRAIPSEELQLLPVDLKLNAAAVPALFGTGVSSWMEGAENGLTNILDFSDVSYDLIQSDRVPKDSHAFHLANPGGADNWFELDVAIDVLADTQLFFPITPTMGLQFADRQSAGFARWREHLARYDRFASWCWQQWRKYFYTTHGGPWCQLC